MALFTQHYTASGDEDRPCGQKQPIAGICSQLAKVHLFASRIMAKVSPRSSRAPRQPAASRDNLRSRHTPEAVQGGSVSRRSKGVDLTSPERSTGGVNKQRSSRARASGRQDSPLLRSAGSADLPALSVDQAAAEGDASTDPAHEEQGDEDGAGSDDDESGGVVLPWSPGIGSALRVPTGFAARWFEAGSHCRIENVDASGILRQGVESASRSLYRTLLDRYPAACFQRWDDPTQVNWGREDMDMMLTSTCPELGMLFTSPESARDCLLNVVDLRNAWAHPYGGNGEYDSWARTTKNIDGWLARAEHLSRTLGDREEESTIRALREELVAKAKGKWDELTKFSRDVREGQPGPFWCSKAILRTFQDYKDDRFVKSHANPTLTCQEIEMLVQYLEGKASRDEAAATPGW